MQPLFRVGYRELLAYELSTTHIRVLLLLVMAVGIIIALALETSMVGRLVAALLPVVLVAATLLILTPGWIGYGVEDSQLVVKTYNVYRIPLGEAEIQLTDYEKVKPVVRLWGLSLPGLYLEVFEFKEMGKGIALVYKPQQKAMVIRHRGKVYVVAHPDVEQAYNTLVEVKLKASQ